MEEQEKQKIVKAFNLLIGIAENSVGNWEYHKNIQESASVLSKFLTEKINETEKPME